MMSENNRYCELLLRKKRWLRLSCEKYSNLLTVDVGN